MSGGIFKKTQNIFEWCNSKIFAIGATAVFVLVAVSIVDIGGRFFFNHPLDGAVEISELIMVIIIFLCFGHSFTEKTHIRVDMFVSKMSKKNEVRLRIIIRIMILFFLVLMVKETAKDAFSKMAAYTNVLEIPLFPFAFLIPIGTAICALSLLMHILDDLGSKRVNKITRDKGENS